MLSVLSSLSPPIERLVFVSVGSSAQLGPSAQFAQQIGYLLEVGSSCFDGSMLVLCCAQAFRIISDIFVFLFWTEPLSCRFMFETIVHVY